MITIQPHAIHSSISSTCFYEQIQNIEERPIDFYINKYSTSNYKISLSTETSKTSSSIRENSTEYNELLINAPWVKNFLQTSPHLDNVKLLLPYYSEINQWLFNKQFDLCNIFLGQLRIHELSDVLLVGLLRLTSSWKNELPAWPVVLDNAKKELLTRGYDSKILLRGLA